MTNEQIAAVLEQIGTMMELRGENQFRVNAYHNAARSLEQLGEDVAALAAAGKLASVRGLGDTLRQQVATLVETGGLPLYDEMRASLPAGLFVSRRFGDPGYAQLSEIAPFEIREGGENGVEIGAFKRALDPIKRADLTAKLREFLPINAIAQLIFET